MTVAPLTADAEISPDSPVIDQASLDQLRERLLTAGWPATPNGRGLYVRCPICKAETVLVVEASKSGRVTIAADCSAGCARADIARQIAELIDARRAEHALTPRWVGAGAQTVVGQRKGLRMKAAETDVGNAQRFCLDWQDEVRHVAGLGPHVYDGRHYRHDDDGAWLRRAVTTARFIVDEGKVLRELAEQQAATAEDGEARAKAKAEAKKADRRFKWAMTSQSAPRLKACIEIARTDSRVIERPDNLDADPWALCVGTGILDLRNDTLRPHTPTELHTRLLPIAYDRDATCPTFERFLATVLQGDTELIDWLQKAIGYTLTGDTREQVAFVLHGDGANGKSTLLNVLVGMLGGHALTIDSSALTTAGRDRAARSDIAQTRGRRAVIASEIPRGAHLDEDLFKRVTGGERISARFNRMDEFEFTPTFKIWLGVNHLPVIVGGGHAIWRRLRIVPFNHRVQRPDLELGRRLHGELPGILAWAVRGCARWQAEGLGTCTAVEAATDAHRREQDQVARFIDERCKRDPAGSVRNTELYDAYATWANTHDLPAIGPRELGSALSRLGFATGKSNGDRVRKGLSL